MKRLILILSLLIGFGTGFSQNLPNTWSSTAGTNTYTTTITSFGSSYTNKILEVRFTNPNTTGATINVTSSSGALGAIQLRKWDGADWVVLTSGDIDTKQKYTLRYDTINGWFEMTPSGSVGGGSSLTLINGNATTVNGTSDGVDWGGAATGDVSITNAAGNVIDWQYNDGVVGPTQKTAGFHFEPSGNENYWIVTDGVDGLSGLDIYAGQQATLVTDHPTLGGAILTSENVASSYIQARLHANNAANTEVANIFVTPTEISFSAGLGGTTYFSTTASTFEFNSAVNGVTLTRLAEASITTPINGMINYNTTTNKFRGYEAGAWADLTGGGGGSGTVTSVGFTGGLISVATATTTPAFTVGGNTGGVVYFSSTSTWASSPTMTANAIMIGGGAGASPQTTTTGTGVLTALGVNVGSAGAFLRDTDLTASRTMTSADDLDQTDNLRIVYTDCAAPCNVTVDLLSTGTQVTVINNGASTATLIEGSGVTLVGTTVPIASGESALIIYETPATPDVYVSTAGGGGTPGGSSGQIQYNNAGAFGGTTTGTGVLTALGVNTGSSGAFVVNGGALGTPSSGTLTNATGLPPTTGISGWPSNASGVLTNNGSGTLSWASSSGWATIGTTTLTGTATIALSTNPLIFTSSVTTGTGATAGIQNTFNSLTTGNGLDLSSSSATVGSIEKITSTSTAVNHTIGSGGLFTIVSSGANGSSSMTAIGASSVVTNTGTTSKNIAGYFASSGATTNIALQTVGGNLFGGTISDALTGSTRVDIRGIATTTGNAIRIADSGNVERFSVTDGGDVNFNNTSGTRIVKWSPLTANFNYIGNSGGFTLTSGGGFKLISQDDFQTGVGNTSVGHRRNSNTSGTTILFNVGEATNGGFNASSGTQIMQMVKVSQTINTTGTFSGGTIIAYDYDPTLTSTTGVSTHLAWRNKVGSVLINGTTITASTMLDQRGLGTTSSTINHRWANSSNTLLATLQDDGMFSVGASAPTSTLQTYGSFAAAYIAKTANYTATSSDHTIECTANTFQVTLPTAVGIAGRIYYIINSGAGTITVGTTSSQTFVNVTATPTTLTMATIGTVAVQSNGANWLKLSGL